MSQFVQKMQVEDRDLADRPLKSVQVRVTNKNDFAVTDRFDGVPFVFEPNKSLVIPAEAANHIFGWTPDEDRGTMFNHTTRRLGWNTPQFSENEKAKKYFDRIEIKSVTFRLVEVEDNDPLDNPTATKGSAPDTQKRASV